MESYDAGNTLSAFTKEKIEAFDTIFNGYAYKDAASTQVSINISLVSNTA